MNSILGALAEAARVRVEESVHRVSYMDMAHRASSMNCDTGFPFEKALSRPGVQFICECKRASPSKGVITEDFPYLDIARDYEDAGAAAISVLTEPTQFLGDIRYLEEVSRTVSVPVLRKDFIVDEYMIYEAKVAGASACLLIASLLNEDDLKRFICICHRLGMSALVECHESGEVASALRCGARVIGVNNRDLRTFSVDLSNAVILRNQVPRSVLFVAESGINTADDVHRLADAGVDAVLVGETLMRATDKKAKLDELRGL